MATPHEIPQDIDPERSRKVLPHDRSQADGMSESIHTAEKPAGQKKAHEGATEDEVSKTSPPAGDAYKDEPKQG